MAGLSGTHAAFFSVIDLFVLGGYRGSTTLNRGATLE